MEREKIAAQCALFACRVCRTKTGWPHQVWCDAADALRPLCADCRYWNETDAVCKHPAVKRGYAMQVEQQGRR